MQGNIVKRLIQWLLNNVVIYYLIIQSCTSNSRRNNGEKVRNKNLFILAFAYYFAQRMKRTEDTYQHKGMRRQLINSLREKGIQDERVLEAMNNIPRHWFLDSAFNKIAYEDRAFPIGEGQTISQPYTVA